MKKTLTTPPTKESVRQVLMMTLTNHQGSEMIRMRKEDFTLDLILLIENATTEGKEIETGEVKVDPPKESSVIKVTLQRKKTIQLKRLKMNKIV